MAEAFQLIVDKHRNETVALVGHVASLTVALAQLCALGPLVWGTPLPHAEPLSGRVGRPQLALPRMAGHSQHSGPPLIHKS
jgi:hypothetical protein